MTSLEGDLGPQSSLDSACSQMNQHAQELQHRLDWLELLHMQQSFAGVFFVSLRFLFVCLFLKASSQGSLSWFSAVCTRKIEH